MQVRVSRKPQPSRFQMFRFQHGVVCSSSDVAKDSNIARSLSSRKCASHSVPISNTANSLQNAGENGDLSVEKSLHPGARGRTDICSLVSGVPSPNVASARLLPSSAKLQN